MQSSDQEKFLWIKNLDPSRKWLQALWKWLPLALSCVSDLSTWSSETHLLLFTPTQLLIKLHGAHLHESWCTTVYSSLFSYPSAYDKDRKLSGYSLFLTRHVPGFLELFLCVCLCVCVCVYVRVCPPPRLLLTSGMIWTPYDWLNKLYSCYMATVVCIVNGRGFGIDMRLWN